MIHNWSSRRGREMERLAERANWARWMDVSWSLDQLILWWDMRPATTVSNGDSKAEHWGITRARTLYAPIKDLRRPTVSGLLQFDEGRPGGCQSPKSSPRSQWIRGWWQFWKWRVSGCTWRGHWALVSSSAVTPLVGWLRSIDHRRSWQQLFREWGLQVHDTRVPPRQFVSQACPSLNGHTPGPHRTEWLRPSI